MQPHLEIYLIEIFNLRDLTRQRQLLVTPPCLSSTAEYNFLSVTFKTNTMSFKFKYNTMSLKHNKTQIQTYVYIVYHTMSLKQCRKYSPLRVSMTFKTNYNAIQIHAQTQSHSNSSTNTTSLKYKHKHACTKYRKDSPLRVSMTFETNYIVCFFCTLLPRKEVFLHQGDLQPSFGRKTPRYSRNVSPHLELFGACLIKIFFLWLQKKMQTIVAKFTHLS